MVPRLSGSSQGIAPLAMKVVATGMPVCDAKARRAGAAPPRITPLPAKRSGSFAASISRAAWKRAGRSGDARPERGETDAGPAREAPRHIGHEGRALLVATGDEADAGVEQGVGQGQRLLAGQPEQRVHALAREAAHQEVGRLHGAPPPSTAAGSAAGSGLAARLPKTRAAMIPTS